MERPYSLAVDRDDRPYQVAVEDFFSRAEPSGPTGRGPHFANDFAQKLFAYEALHPSAARFQPDPPPEPYSLQWFLDIENQRHSKHGKWIPKLLEFAKHSGETLLGLGHGLGTDWVQYARHGADVIVCTSSHSQLNLVRRNFELRGLDGRFIFADPVRLPLESSSVDVACLSSLALGIDDVPGVVEEVYRVLKPGGKVLAVTPARFDLDFWFHSLFFWYRWVATSPRQGPAVDQRFTRFQLKRLFHRYVEHRIHKRQLRRSEVPWIWRPFPVSFLARLMGRVLVLKAFKPLRENAFGE